MTSLSAGLWEFPAVIVPEDCSPAERSAALQSCLQGSLQQLGCDSNLLSTARRKQLGCVNHVFSHINMALLVDHILIEVCPPEVMHNFLRASLLISQGMLLLWRWTQRCNVD